MRKRQPLKSEALYENAEIPSVSTTTCRSHIATDTEFFRTDANYLPLHFTALETIVLYLGACFPTVDVDCLPTGKLPSSCCKPRHFTDWENPSWGSHVF